LEPSAPIRMKEEPLSGAYVIGTLAAMLSLEVLPDAEELLRDWAEHPGRLVPPPRV
jgi:hypothetical protein